MGTSVWNETAITPQNHDAPRAPAHVDTLPVYVDTPGSIVKLKKDEIFVSDRHGNRLLRRGLNTISNLNLYGGAHITTPTLKACLNAEIPVCFFSSRGWYKSRTEPHPTVEFTRALPNFRHLKDREG